MMPVPTPVEVIEISYSASPRGQVGPRPKVLTANSRITFTTHDPGDMIIEFKGASPLADGSMFVPAGKTVEAVIPGKYKFKCHLKRPNAPDIVLDPDDPDVPGGGAMDVVPDVG